MRFYHNIFLLTGLCLSLFFSLILLTPLSSNAATFNQDNAAIDLASTQIISTTTAQPDERNFDTFIYLPILFKSYDPTQNWHGLAVNKTVSTSSIQAGDRLTYTISYNVFGNESAPSLTLVDTLPANVLYQSCTGGLSCSESSGTVTWQFGDVGPNTNNSVTLVVEVNSTVISGTILENDASLADSSGLMVSDTVTTSVSAATHTLTLEKTALADRIYPGDLLTYTLSYSVNGIEPAPSLTLEDTLPVSTTYQSCTGGLSCSEASGTVTWEFGDVNPGMTAVVTLGVRVDSTVISGTLLENGATLTDGSGLSATDTATTLVNDPPTHTLTLDKTALANLVHPGQLLTYTLRYTVSGTEMAPDVTLVDTLPQSTTFQTCAGEPICEHANGLVTWALGDLAPATTGLVTMTVAVDPAVISGTMLYNTAMLTDAGGKLTPAEAETLVQMPNHNLSISKISTTDQVQPGGKLTYQINYTVTGSELAPDVTIVDTLPQSMTFKGCYEAIYEGVCYYSEGENSIKWTLGDVSPNTTGVVTFTTTVDRAVISGTILYNTAAISDTSGLVVSDTASTLIAETEQDIVIVFDASNSMQFSTICHGCYEPYGDGDIPWQDLPTADPNYDPQNPIFPNPAYIRPIPATHLPQNPFAVGGVPGVGQNLGRVCAGRDGNPTEYFQVVSAGGNQSYIIMEAELYTRKTNSFYQSRFRSPGQGFWAVQHTNFRTLYKMEGNTSDIDGSYETGATPIQPSYSIGSWVSHHPYVSWSIPPSFDPPGIPYGRDYTLADAQNDYSPGLEYQFFTDSNWEDSDGGQTRIYVRMQGGPTWFADNDVEGYRRVFWTILTEEGGPVLDANWTPVGINPSPQAPTGANYGGADGDRWAWLELTDGLNIPLQNNKTYILKIWAGGVGVDLDRIVIGNGNSSQARNTTLPPTAGSAFGEACNRCNPIYGQTIGSFDECTLPSDNGYVIAETLDMTQDELYSGYQPLRGIKEASKRFIRKLNPGFDQVGFVPYSTSTVTDGVVELQCLRRAQVSGGVVECVGGANPISYTHLLDVVERVPPTGSTNIGAGMQDGLKVLGINVDASGDFDNSCNGTTNSHCGRGSAVDRILIVMTDGFPTVSPAGCGAGSGYIKHRSCVISYTQQAADNGVRVYTIGIGHGADGELLSEMADIGGGQYFLVLSPSRLDQAFEMIASSIP